MGLMEKSLELKFQRLGFTPSDHGMEARIGRIRLNATEHPLKGVALFFTSDRTRTACQYEVFIPAATPVETIAHLIYGNVRLNFKEDIEACKKYLNSANIALEVK